MMHVMMIDVFQEPTNPNGGSEYTMPILSAQIVAYLIKLHDESSPRYGQDRWTNVHKLSPWIS